MSSRVILHADMDAFFAAVEQRDRPELRGRPVVVGGLSDRGVVSTASYEARPFGVHSALPMVEARRRCPHAVFLAPDHRRYARESARIFGIFRRFTPRVEALSLDEAFLDLTGTGRLLGPPREVARAIRKAVREETGLAVSCGIAPVKFAAKLASDLAKPDGLLEVPPGGLRAFLEPLPVGRLWGVGPVAEARLRRAGFASIGSVARADLRSLEAVVGSRAVQLRALARGEDPREVEPSREPVSLSEEHTFPEDVREPADLLPALRRHAEAVARRLRARGLRARTVVLKLKLGRRRAPGPRGHPLRTRRITLREPTDEAAVIVSAARALLLEAPPEEPVRLLGVGVTGLAPAGSGQLPLFGGGAQQERRRRLERALDEIRERFGPEAVVAGEDAERRQS